jgi:hypothetical protein
MLFSLSINYQPEKSPNFVVATLRFFFTYDSSTTPLPSALVAPAVTPAAARAAANDDAGAAAAAAAAADRFFDFLLSPPPPPLSMNFVIPPPVVVSVAERGLLNHAPSCASRCSCSAA